MGLEFFQRSPCFRPWIPFGIVHFVGFGVFQGLEGSGWRWKFFWIKMGVKRGGLTFLIAVAPVRDCVFSQSKAFEASFRRSPRRHLRLGQSHSSDGSFFGWTFRIGQSNPSDGSSFGWTFRLGQSHPSDGSFFGRTFCIGQSYHSDGYLTVQNGHSLRSHPQDRMVRPSSLSCHAQKPYNYVRIKSFMRKSRTSYAQAASSA